MAKTTKRRQWVRVRVTSVSKKMRAEFPSRLRRIRLDQGLQQRELANVAGVHEMALSYWERGRRFPNVENAMKLAEALNVSIRYLFGLTDRRHDGREKPPKRRRHDAEEEDET